MSTPRDLARHPAVQLVDLVGAHGVRLAALRARPDGRARASLLLVHGFTGSKEDFAPVLPALAEAGVDAVSLDLRGQHESDAAPDAYDLEHFAADVVAVAGTLPHPVHLLGHSFGGLVARDAVLAAPDLFASLTLLCTGPGAVPSDLQEPLSALEKAMAAGEVELVWTHLRDTVLAEHPDLPDEIHAFLHRRFHGSDPHSHRRIAQHLRTAGDRSRELAALALDVHVIRGEHDDVWPHEQQDDVAAILDTTVRVIAGAGHSPAVEDPEGTVAALLAGPLAELRDGDGSAAP